MKKVLVDIYKANRPYSGLGQFSINFHEALVAAATEDLELHFLHPKSFTDRNSGFSYHPISFKNRYLPTASPKVDIWHSLHQFPSHPPHPGSTSILTIHDLNFLTQKNEAKAQKYLRRLQKNVDRADVLTTISAFTKSEIGKHLDVKGKDIHVIHNGVKLPEFPNASRPGYVPGGPFFFSIGIFSEKKNFEVLLPLIKEFPEHKLLIAGDCETSYGKFIQQQIKSLGLADQVILPGKISDEDKYWLYRNAEALLFPSLAEGFGLPVIEAFQAGIPAFLSTSSSLPEVGGNKAFYWNDFKPKSMKKVVQQGLKEYHENPDKSARFLQEYGQKFSWDRAIENYLSLYSSVK